MEGGGSIQRYREPYFAIFGGGSFLFQNSQLIIDKVQAGLSLLGYRAGFGKTRDCNLCLWEERVVEGFG